MTNMFKVSDPSQARGTSITAREILDKASQQIDSGRPEPRRTEPICCTSWEMCTTVWG